MISTEERVPSQPDVFSVDDKDIGEVNSTFLETSLNDQVPAQQSYNSIPRPLHEEFKYYIEDLLNK